jgi:alpha-tubulin suppressor-like RCC1 family protein
MTQPCRYSCALIRSALLAVTFLCIAGSALGQTVAAGLNHTVILKSDGTVWAVGADDYGQLGDCLIYRNCCRILG